MRAWPEHDERSHGLGGVARVAPPVRHQSYDLLGDLSTLAYRAVRFQRRKDRLERIAVDARNTLDLFRSRETVRVEGIASG
jgi:hypothetical protein